MERSEMTTNKEQINRNRPENNTDIRLKNKDIKKDIIYIYIYIYNFYARGRKKSMLRRDMEIEPNLLYRGKVESLR